MSSIERCPICEVLYDDFDGKILTCGHPGCVKEAKQFLEEYRDIENFKEEIEENTRKTEQILKEKLDEANGIISKAKDFVREVEGLVNEAKKSMQI